jgi:hypothetical protein
LEGLERVAREGAAAGVSHLRAGYAAHMGSGGCGAPRRGSIDPCPSTPHAKATLIPAVASQLVGLRRPPSSDQGHGSTRMARERASTRSATAETLADAVQDADRATGSQRARTSARQHMHLGWQGGTPRGIGARDASKCLPTSKMSSCPMQPACLGALRPPCRHIGSSHLPGGEGTGGNWVARAYVVNDNVRDAGPEGADGKGRAWHRRGSVRRNFRPPSIAKVRARTFIMSSRARSTRGAAARGQRATAVPSDPAQGARTGFVTSDPFSYEKYETVGSEGRSEKPSALFHSLSGGGVFGRPSQPQPRAGPGKSR